MHEEFSFARTVSKTHAWIYEALVYIVDSRNLQRRWNARNMWRSKTERERNDKPIDVMQLKQTLMSDKKTLKRCHYRLKSDSNGNLFKRDAKRLETRLTVDHWAIGQVKGKFEVWRCWVIGKLTKISSNVLTTKLSFGEIEEISQKYLVSHKKHDSFISVSNNLPFSIRSKPLEAF